MSRSRLTLCSVVGSAIQILCSFPNSTSGCALGGRATGQSSGTGSSRRASKSLMLFSLTMARNPETSLAMPFADASRSPPGPPLRRNLKGESETSPC